MAGVVAVEVTGGPEVPFHPGREVSEISMFSIYGLAISVLTLYMWSLSFILDDSIVVFLSSLLVCNRLCLVLAFDCIDFIFGCCLLLLRCAFFQSVSNSVLYKSLGQVYVWHINIHVF